MCVRVCSFVCEALRGLKEKEKSEWTRRWRPMEGSGVTKTGPSQRFRVRVREEARLRDREAAKRERMKERQRAREGEN